MRRVGIVALLTLLCACSGTLQEPATPRGEGPSVVLITIDGLRWQEVFTGADPYLIGHEAYVHDAQYLREHFWAQTTGERRERLMPFLWREFGAKGQLYGNREYGCEANLANTHWFSYPGYNELLVGYPDDERIASNDPVDNPNVTVLEKIHQLPEFRGRVAGAAMWDPIGNAVNETRSGIPMRTSVESLGSYPGASAPAFFADLGESGGSLFEHGGLAAGSVFSGAPWAHMRDRYLDKVTFNNAMDLVEEIKPRVLYLALGAPDEDAHHGNYEGYLLSVRQMDDYIHRLHDALEAMPEYAGNTTYIVTVDHGRGLEEEWTSHGKDFLHSDEIWFALLGPQVSARGEVREPCQLQLAQVASTVADLLGVTYENEWPVAPALPYLD